MFKDIFLANASKAFLGKPCRASLMISKSEDVAAF
jgi:hypothetical protein